MWGYEHYEGLGWRDAFVNAAMLLGGMAPVNAPRTDAEKVFAGLLCAPLVHRLLHRLHWEEGGGP